MPRLHRLIGAMKIFVAGATGYLGAHLVREALARDYEVRALTRREGAFDGPPVEELVAEVTDPPSLAGACAGCTAVVSALGITRQTDDVGYDDVDFRGNLAILREAEAANVERFLYVSVLHPEHTIHTDMVAAKERFVRALEQSPIPSTIVRPTGFFSDMEEFLDMARRGRAYVFGAGETKLNPIHGADLAGACLDALESKEDEVEVGGPDVLTQREIAKLAFDVLGRETRISGVPLWLVDGALALVKPFRRRWWNVGSFMASAGRHDMVGPARGDHHLEDYFRSRV